MFELWIILVILILFALSIVIPKRLRSRLAGELSSCLMTRDFDRFDRLIEKRSVQFVFDPFNIDFMKLNAALVKQDPAEIDRRFANLRFLFLSGKRVLYL